MTMCHRNRNLAWVEGFYSPPKKKQLKSICFGLKKKKCQPLINFGFVELYRGVFHCLRAQTKLSGCFFQNVSSYFSTQDEEVEHPSSHNPCHNQKLSRKETPQKEENSNFSSHVIFQTLLLHGSGAGKEREAIT